MSYAGNKSEAKALETKAIAVERSITSQTSTNAALEAIISSCELHMQALKLVDDPTERRRLDLKCKELLAKAESIKAGRDGKPTMAKAYPGDMKQPKSSRKLTTRENIIILEGCKLNGAVFKPWTQPPTKADFELKDGEELYLETPHLPLSAFQQQSFAGWRRPKEALRMIEVKKNGVVLSNNPTMLRVEKIDLVQDMTSDCSVVASLCAGTARAERGHPRILGSILYPYDYDEDQIILSPNGKYILRLYFNGCWRRVEIDDLLPTSNTSRVLHVIDRSNPGLLWPALVEKAYLKVRGGYDFPGSNSGTDLAVLTGWIPQQVFLHDQGLDVDELWDELYHAFTKGDMLLTIGTGKLPRREQKQLGLAAEHDYAVLELQVTAGVKEMLIKNPWSDGDVWIGASKRRPNPGHNPSKTDQPSNNNSEMLPGTFWMDFNSVFHYFENMYINWNPGLLTHRQDLHFSWVILDTVYAPNVFSNNPQFSVTASASGEIWLLLNRHFRTGDYTHTNSGKNGYISLYLFDANGTKVFYSDRASIRGPFVDSPNTLLRFQVTSNVAYTVVTVSQDLPPGKHNFTLSALANSAVTLADSQSKYQNQVTVASAWTRINSGGNSDSPCYLNNPQFNCEILADNTKVAVVLRLTSDPKSDLSETNIHIKFLLVHNPTNRRITKLRPRDIVVTSGDYRRGSAVMETMLSQGNYAIICSTFEENQFAKFEIDLHIRSPTSSTQTPTLLAIPSESSGRHSIVSAPAIFADGTSKIGAPVTIPRISKAIFIARPARQYRSQTNSNLMYKLSLQHGQGPYAKIIASSAEIAAEFNSATSGIRIEDQDLNPRLFGSETGGLWLVLERPAGQIMPDGEATATGPLQVLEVEMLAEERIEIGDWNTMC